MCRSIVAPLLFALSTLSLCASAGGDVKERQVPPDVHKFGPVQTQKLEQPVLRAVLIPTSGESVVAEVSGHAFLNRAEGERHKPLSVGDRIKAADLLELEKDALVRLRDQKGNLIDLQGEEGPWFKIE